MADRQTLLEGNRREREQLLRLIGKLKDENYALPMEGGWTVAAVLAHLAFWDRRALTLLRKWKQTGVQPSVVDTDVINEASRALCLAIPPGNILKLVSEAARELDAEIERLDSAFFMEVDLRGRAIHLDRAEHRHLHRAEIERALGFRTTQPLTAPAEDSQPTRLSVRKP